jgi:hypothetical protein
MLQLSLEAMLRTLKACPAIEKEVEVWNNDLVIAVRQQTGFAHVIEKVSHVIPSPLLVIIFFFPWNIQSSTPNHNFFSPSYEKLQSM